VLLDVGEGQPHASFVRVEYDIAKTMRAIRDSELPNEFAEDLRTGGSHEPSVEYTTIDPGAERPALPS
jgi:hypothetical protein